MLQLTADQLRGWGPFGSQENRIAVFSVGNPCEGHSPALPRDIDDRVARALALRACDSLGAYYCGHVPFTSDRVGEIAKDWSPLWIPQEEMVRRTGAFIHRVLAEVALRFEAVFVVNGHGGNNFLENHEDKLTEIAGRRVFFVIPFEGIQAGHADTPEHSVAAYLGLVDAERLAELNEVAEADPLEALRRWPPIGGLGGYIWIGGDRYDELRKKEYGLVDCLEGFLQDRCISADISLGRRLFDQMLENLAAAISEGIDKQG